MRCHQTFGVIPHADGVQEDVAELVRQRNSGHAIPDGASDFINRDCCAVFTFSLPQPQQRTCDAVGVEPLLVLAIGLVSDGLDVIQHMAAVFKGEECQRHVSRLDASATQRQSLTGGGLQKQAGALRDRNEISCVGDERHHASFVKLSREHATLGAEVDVYPWVSIPSRIQFEVIRHHPLARCLFSTSM